MKHLTWILCICVVVVVGAGCGAKKEKEAIQALNVEVAQLRAEIKQLESKQAEQLAEAQRAGLKASDEKVSIDERLKAANLRLIHQGLDQFRVTPVPTHENGWLLVSGEHTYTLLGFSDASFVKFYWADGQVGLSPQLLGEDRSGANGWSFTGTVPLSIAHALWAEIHYPGGISTTSSVLPLRNAGK